jgi:hypothetical protein
VKNWKKLLKIAGIAVGALLAVLLICNVFLIWSSGSQLGAKLEALRAAGDPVTLTDLARPLLPPEENAAVFLHRARADVQAISQQLRPIFDGTDYQAGRLGESDRTAVRAAFAAYPRLMPLLERAAACPDYDAEHDYAANPQALLGTLLSQADDFRAALNVLSLRARLQAAEGDRDAALQTCLRIFRLARHFDHEPTNIGYLVALAGRAVGVKAAELVLRAGPLSDQARAALEVELALHDGFEGYARALKSERAFALDSMRVQVPDVWVNRFWLNYEQCDLIDLTEQHLALASQPLRDFKQGLATGGSGTRGWVTRQLNPVLTRVREATDRARALVRCLRVLNALQRAVRPGAAEPTITGLGLPAEAIRDPFADGPLQIQKVGADWLIRSASGASVGPAPPDGEASPPKPTAN